MTGSGRPWRHRWPYPRRARGTNDGSAPPGHRPGRGALDVRDSYIRRSVPGARPLPGSGPVLLGHYKVPHSGMSPRSAVRPRRSAWSNTHQTRGRDGAHVPVFAMWNGAVSPRLATPSAVPVASRRSQIPHSGIATASATRRRGGTALPSPPATGRTPGAWNTRRRTARAGGRATAPRRSSG
jgi:hypothetical protein